MSTKVFKKSILNILPEIARAMPGKLNIYIENISFFMLIETARLQLKASHSAFPSDRR
jgi:hypothetical protein